MPESPIVVLTPLFNDWASCAVVAARLDQALANWPGPVELLIVDDGSLEPRPEGFGRNAGFVKLGKVSVLRLAANLGHQRAIAVGLAQVEATREFRAVAVMDSDGEDEPADVPRLLAACAETGWSQVVFAERRRRSESLTFRCGYRAYRWMHRLLTGIAVRVGNFSVVPRDRVRSLVTVSNLWRHYAAAVFQSRQPLTMIPTHRGRRVAGESRLNFVALVRHGLAAISVFNDIVGVRLMLVTMGLAALAAVGIAVVVAIRLGTDLAIPGWATSAAGLLFLALLHLLALALGFSFLVLNSRNSLEFIPRRDFQHFVLCEETIHDSRADADRPSPPAQT